MTDRELLEAAAMAAGIKILCDPHGAWRNCTGREPAMNIFSAPLWNPLTDDGDCARLEAQLMLHVEWRPMLGTVYVGTAEIGAFVAWGVDRQAARRKATVRAAAAMAPKG